MSVVTFVPWPAGSSVVHVTEGLEEVEVRKPSGVGYVCVEHDRGWTASWVVTEPDLKKVYDAVEVKRLEAARWEDQVDVDGLALFAQQWDYVEEMIRQLVETLGISEDFRVESTPLGRSR